MYGENINVSSYSIQDYSFFSKISAPFDIWIYWLYVFLELLPHIDFQLSPKLVHVLWYCVLVALFSLFHAGDSDTIDRPTSFCYK
jgi:hypothetical protein